MAVKINFNEAAAKTHTALIINERAMNKSLLRLSTGYRILSAADDSAGLYIADMLGTVAAALDQGNRNIQTGISALQIAESAAGQIYTKLQEIYVRTQSAANDINDPEARSALQEEIMNFVDAIQKIATDTEYNGIKLLNGDFSNKYIHYGVRMEQTVYLSISDIRAQSIGAHMIHSQGSAASGTGAITNLTNYVSTTAITVNIGGRTITATYHNGSNYIIDAAKIANEINSNLYDVGFEAKAVNVSIADEYTAIASGTGTVSLTFYVGDDSFSLTGINKTITLTDLIEEINREAATAGANLTAKEDNGRLVLTATNGETIGIEVTGVDSTDTVNLNQLIQGASAQSGTASAIRVGELYIGRDNSFTADLSSVTNALGTIDVGSATSSEFKNLYAIEVTTNSGAEMGIMIAEIAMTKVDSVRAQIGATMNNLQSIYDSQKSAYDNTKEAESIIRNTDYAKEMSEFTSYQIRMQATIAMLAQANTLPQLVLQLLR
ncbi:MAG: flagellin [Thermodesulfobacteriota bacterium]|nr:MAG: flagellin [Thermodesulfobacteriota bacterium]